MGFEPTSIIGFYNVDKPYGFFSNWYPSEFTVDGIKYSSSEQYMMHQKAVTFKDSATAEKILATNDQAYIKALGRVVANYKESVWSGMRQLIVFTGLMAKFSQNEDLRKALLDTGDAFLVECSPRDHIWGIGLSLDNDAWHNIDNWKGQNLLGYTLMAVRERLRNEA